MSKLILGLDGGATKSHLVIFDSGGKCVGISSYGPLNHEVMSGSYSELEARLKEFIPRALYDVGATVDDVAYAVYGLAGDDTDAQHKKITDAAEQVGIKNYLVCNDAFLGVPAGCPDCVGICVINGTGFKVAAIAAAGETLQICGLGGYSNDYGGGPWYGMKAVGAVYSSLFMLGKQTLMQDFLFKAFGISSKEEMLGAINKRIEKSSFNDIEINSIAFKAAALGDEVALSILDQSAEQYAGATAWLAMNMDFPKCKTLYISLIGSVNVKQPVRILHDMIEKRVRDALGERPVQYVRLDVAPVAGAVIWAAQKAGFDIKMESIKASLAEL